MSKNLIWLAIGGVVAYLLLTGKKASATKVEEPQKGSDSTPKEPRSQADCSEGEIFSPSESAKDITLTKKDGTIEIVKKEGKPAYCWKPHIRGKGLGLPLPPDKIENNRYENLPIGFSKELNDAILDLGKISDSSLKMQYDNLECNPIQTAIKLTSEQVREMNLKKRALIYVADQRGIKLDCDINIKKFERNKISPVYDGNIKRLATGIN